KNKDLMKSSVKQLIKSLDDKTIDPRLYHLIGIFLNALVVKRNAEKAKKIIGQMNREATSESGQWVVTFRHILRKELDVPL
ncbi:MAG: hypothetical protein MHPSP_003798, partial [Paramarteilia canceri]